MLTSKTAVRLTFRLGLSKSDGPDTGGCYAVRLNAEEYWKHGLDGFCSGGENLANGAWALSFCVCKRWSIRGAAVRLHGAARRQPVWRRATTLSWTLLSSTLPPALPLLYDNYTTVV